MDLAALRHDRAGDVADKALQEFEEADLAEFFGDGGGALHVDEQEHTLLDARPVVAPGGEVEQHALSDQPVDAEQDVETDAQHDREYYAGLAEDAVVPGYEPGARSETEQDHHDMTADRAARNTRNGARLSGPPVKTKVSKVDRTLQISAPMRPPRSSPVTPLSSFVCI